MNSLPRHTANAIDRPNRRAIAEWTVARIYDQIFRGELAPGQALGEIELAEQLNVSRSPVREALRELETMGVVESSPVTGRRVVAGFGPEDIYELYSIRVQLEALAHAHAARHIAAGEMAELEALQVEMERLSDDEAGHASHLEADFRFHDIVCGAAQLPRLYRTVSAFWLQTRALVKQLDALHVYPASVELANVQQDHRAIIEALRSGDGEAASAAITRHLEERRDALIAAVAEQGGFHHGAAPSDTTEEMS